MFFKNTQSEYLYRIYLLIFGGKNRTSLAPYLISASGILTDIKSFFITTVQKITYADWIFKPGSAELKMLWKKNFLRFCLSFYQPAKKAGQYF